MVAGGSRHPSSCPNPPPCLYINNNTGNSGDSDPKRAPEWPRDAIFDAFGSIFESISEFFKVALRECFASQRKGPNLDFDWHARYIGAFLHFAKKPTINKNRRKAAPQTVCKRGARKKLAFFVPGGASASILVAPKRSGALPGALPGARGRPSGLSGRPLDAAGTIPG